MAEMFDINQLAALLGQQISAEPFVPLMSAQNAQSVPTLQQLQQITTPPQAPIGALAAGNLSATAPTSPFPLIAAMTQGPEEAKSEEESREEKLKKLLQGIQGAAVTPPQTPAVDPNFRGGVQSFPGAGNANSVQNIMSQLFANQTQPAPSLAQLMLGGGRR